MGLRDATDDVVLETAIVGRADYLVMYDKDLLELKPSVAEYVERHGLRILRDTRVHEGEVDFCTVIRSLVAEQ